jgi:phosphate butyryltransferase
VLGDADILIFPNFECANTFYKGLSLFANAEMAGLLQGTDKPVVLTSRSESIQSKFYSIAMACVLA